jgi:hypothetical protein
MFVGLMLLLSVQASAPPKDATFSGFWERDEERSDDPKQKMEASMEKMREEMSRRGGGGPPGGGAPPMPPPGGMPGGGRRRPGGRESQGGPPDFTKIPDELRVEIDDREFRVDDGERVRIYYLDGKKHKRELDNGTKLETASVLRGNAVVIEEKMERGSIDRKYELSLDGETMVSTLTVEFGPMKDPVVIKTVYVRGRDAS